MTRLSAAPLLGFPSTRLRLGVGMLCTRRKRRALWRLSLDLTAKLFQLRFQFLNSRQQQSNNRLGFRRLTCDDFFRDDDFHAIVVALGPRLSPDQFSTKSDPPRERLLEPIAVSPKNAARRVVVIEPRRELGYVTKRFLEIEGHVVYYATDGLAAVELATAIKPDVVTTPIEVPTLDGFEIAREIRKRFVGELRLIATTSYSKNEIGSKLKASGFDFYLAKPLSRELLVSVVGANDTDNLPQEVIL